MAALLAVSMASLVGLALVVVLAIQFVVGGRTTGELLRAKVELLVELVSSRVREQMDPAALQLSFIAEMLAHPDAHFSRERIADLMTGALSGAPNVMRMAFIGTDGGAAIVDRGYDGAEISLPDLAANPAVQAALAAARARSGGWWGEFVFAPGVQGPAVNRRHAVWRGGTFVGVLGALVPLRELSSTIGQSTVDQYGGTPFILYGDSEVLGHRRLLARFDGLTPARPLPTVAEIGDPVLAQIWDRKLTTPLLRNTGIAHSVSIDGDIYHFLHKALPEFGDVPWTVGAYFRAEDLTGSMRNIALAGIGGLGVVALALIAAFLLAKRLALPTQRFAQTAAQLATLDFDRAQSLPSSRIRELDEQAQAFNRLLGALRWFEAYVPRKLVRQLAQAGTQSDLPSQTREVTVLFSDIVGFTTRAQNLSPAETAALLNRHFAVAIDAIEATGGTVDKFMGDGIMAFWGAPDPLENHARAALAAARAIAASAAACDVRLRLGLHSGPVVAGNVGSAKRLNYTVLGDTVNAAQRIESLGHSLMPPDARTCVLASAATVEAAGGAVDFERAGEFMLRGRNEPVSIFRLRADAGVPPAP